MMGAAPFQIQLSWEEPVTGERRSPVLTVPIALGREFSHMPALVGEQRVCRVVLASDDISRFHALITFEPDGLVVTDQSSINGTLVNGVLHHRSFLANGDTIQIGPYAIAISFAVTPPAPAASPPAPPSLAATQLPDPPFAVTELPSPEEVNLTDASFPPTLFQNQQVSVQDLFATGLPVQETDYAAIGAGLGSFCWVDLLRICGVHTAQIIALGMEPQPYARYQRLCLNSQIPSHERLRSNSDSCPDNIWGWPSYALREAWHDLSKGRPLAALKYLWQVFAEPTFAETYTPRASNVFASLDREAKRIGWEQMFLYGRVRGIRKTNDGRYAIAYSRSTSQQRDHAFLVARYVQLATGYPAIQFLPDLQAYREQTKDFKSVVNAYENHDHVYEHLERQGGTVLIRGRGIVASRIVQRLYEARQKNPHIAVLHLMRSPKPQGNKFGFAQRHVENHYEFQPFNWPKACWSGELRTMLEQADPQQRQSLLAVWGGTTTADRADWRRMVEEGLSQGWYQITFGEVERVEPDERDRPVTYIQEQNLKGQMRLEADFVIDATGLEAKVKTNPLLDDLVTQYSLPLNPLGRLSVANDFELVEMRNGRGRMYAAGAMTLGGPYAAVDSFLGLQYAALCAVADLAKMRAPSLQRLHPVRSLSQWFKWVIGQPPS
ncbi:FHA domain-containing protein [Trichocoleus desertorum AS-A10]|uniref:FHA domain-containing protein n=1 Tax=Trichocoleus desertorum TaxID=1481672 RepID=UPI00329EF668